jgi:probable HAF family extracellular repeat protein
MPRACLFDKTGSGANINLGTLGGDASEAYSINDAGQIVGWSYDSSSNSRACLFDPTGRGNNIDLNTLVAPSSGWFLYSANYINDNGWIVGNGTIYGQSHAFLLTPEPGTLLLLGLGMAMLKGKRRAV